LTYSEFLDDAVVMTWHPALTYVLRIIRSLNIRHPTRKLSPLHPPAPATSRNGAPSPPSSGVQTRAIAGKSWMAGRGRWRLGVCERNRLLVLGRSEIPRRDGEADMTMGCVLRFERTVSRRL
jgi:hypothetical protein